MKVSFLKLKTVPGHIAFVRVPGNEHVAVYHITGQRGSWTLDYSRSPEPIQSCSRNNAV